MDVSKALRPRVGSLPKYVPGEFREGFVKLASNENNYGPSPKVVEALKEWADKTQLYPYRGDELRGKLAKYVGCSRENICLGNGSDELMDLLVKVFKGPYGGSYPSFANYEIVAGMMGEDYIEVALEDDFRFDADRFNTATKNCALLFLCSPNNPTGTSISDAELKKVLETGKIVVLDEAYVEFCGNSRVSWIKKYPNLIVLRTMSKAFALAGVRMGYSVASADVTSALLKVKPPFNTNSLSEAAALAALDDLGYMRECVTKIREDTAAIYEALSKKYKPVKSDSNFVLCDVSPLSAQEFFDKMIEAEIIIRKFGAFQATKGNYIRVSAGTKGETQKFVEALGRP